VDGHDNKCAEDASEDAVYDWHLAWVGEKSRNTEVERKKTVKELGVE
jgi:hypothetical protein